VSFLKVPELMRASPMGEETLPSRFSSFCCRESVKPMGPSGPPLDWQVQVPVMGLSLSFGVAKLAANKSVMQMKIKMKFRFIYVLFGSWHLLFALPDSFVSVYRPSSRERTLFELAQEDVGPLRGVEMDFQHVFPEGPGGDLRAPDG